MDKTELTLQDVLSKKIKEVMKSNLIHSFYPDYKIIIRDVNEDGVYLTIHPFRYAGDTIGFVVKGNNLEVYNKKIHKTFKQIHPTSKEFKRIIDN